MKAAYLLLLLFRRKKKIIITLSHGPKTPLVACVFYLVLMYLFLAQCEQVYLFLALAHNNICWETFLIFFAFFAPQAQYSTQYTPINPHKQQSKYASIRARQRKQADRVGSSQHVEHLYSSLYFQNERRNPNLPGLHRYYHCCCTYRFKKYPRIRKNIPVGMISFHPRKNSPPLLL